MGASLPSLHSASRKSRVHSTVTPRAEIGDSLVSGIIWKTIANTVTSIRVSDSHLILQLMLLLLPLLVLVLRYSEIHNVGCIISSINVITYTTLLQ